ncbi:MAG: hypothetical protein R3208_21335 [Ketobacteraceae bacterium]|nr:hypothetical protein [Ketobacteraceae bacterium]
MDVRWGAVLLMLFAAGASAQAFYELETPCNPVSVATCALPYPSDVYAYEAPDSPTGMRLKFPDGAIRPELLDEVPPTLTPQGVFDGSSGYSAASSVLFELDLEPDTATLPPDGGDAVIAIDLATGELVPVRVQINEYARSRRVSSPSQVIEIYPRSRWRFGGRYAVFLTNNLKPWEGGDYEPGPGFMEAISDNDSPLSRFYEPVIRVFEGLGYDRNQLISATFFTVRDELEATQPLMDLAESVYEKEHPVRNLKIHYKLFGHIGAFVSGELLVHNFRDEYGGMIYDTAAARENWVSFRLTLPRVAKQGPVPVAIYGHGLSVFKETDFLVSVNNARMGIATVSIDHPNHGSRIRPDGGYALARLDTPYVPLQVGMMVQSSVDFMSLLKAVKTSIGELDILPKRFWAPLWTRRLNNGDGIPDLDTSRIFYQGTSLGGVLGSAFVSIAPDLKGAFFQVTGVGVTNILAGSALWDGFFSNLEPDIATGAEAMLLKAAMQHELDYGDAINFVHYLRNPRGMAIAKPVVISAGDGDQIVPNFSTIAFAEIAGLPQVNEPLFAMPGIVDADDFDNGYGVLHYPSVTQTTSDLVDGLAAHVSFMWPELTQDMNAWIRQFVLK